jgi:LPS-assembly lipoprotein
MRNLLRLALVCLLLPLTGCGFQPLYGSKAEGGSGAAVALNQVAIANIPNREGQMLRNLLTDRLYQNGKPVEPHYRLAVELRESETALGIRRDATASRTRLDMQSHYVLRRVSDDKVLIDSTGETSVSFNQLVAQYATVTARDDARSRALHELSEQIMTRLALYFGTTTP